MKEKGNAITEDLNTKVIACCGVKDLEEISECKNRSIVSSEDGNAISEIVLESSPNLHGKHGNLSLQFLADVFNIDLNVSRTNN